MVSHPVSLIFAAILGTSFLCTTPERSQAQGTQQQPSVGPAEQSAKAPTAAKYSAKPTTSTSAPSVIDYTKTPIQMTAPGNCNFKIPFEILSSPLIMKEPLTRQQIKEIALWNSHANSSRYCENDKVGGRVELQFYLIGERTSVRCRVYVQMTGEVKDKAFASRLVVNRYVSGCDTPAQANAFPLAVPPNANAKYLVVWVHNGKIYLRENEFLATDAGKLASQQYEQRKKADAAGLRAGQAALAGALTSIATKGKLPSAQAPAATTGGSNYTCKARCLGPNVVRADLGKISVTANTPAEAAEKAKATITPICKKNYGFHVATPGANGGALPDVGTCERS